MDAPSAGPSRRQTSSVGCTHGQTVGIIANQSVCITGVMLLLSNFYVTWNFPRLCSNLYAFASSLSKVHLRPKAHLSTLDFQPIKSARLSFFYFDTSNFLSTGMIDYQIGHKPQFKIYTPYSKTTRHLPQWIEKHKTSAVGKHVKGCHGVTNLECSFVFIQIDASFFSLKFKRIFYLEQGGVKV